MCVVNVLCRLAKVEETKSKLQENLRHAERQLGASEARTTSLQAALEKSEEKAASLDLQLKAKSPVAAGKLLLRHVIHACCCSLQT